ncbi:uncharacterized protein LOC121860419 isoform X2 [Homarus americanus]|uniref:uncharacterized protein LOC121860419 isoform X2 n=1 Tax=Homarus americanus TaxID=6706 RepID=UPI001C47DE38|nr:uncharacterized protein LOC121860419 isoform X2 [Homarus americanus]
MEAMDRIGEVVPIKPLWVIQNQLNLPVYVEGKENVELVTTVVLVIKVAIELSTVFNPDPSDGRSVGLDQASLYQHLEGSLAIVGLEGRTCLLRLVCDAQSPALLRLNLMGSLLAAIFTPREEAVMEEYKEAARVGRARESCAKHYPSCPFSIFNIFNPKRNSQTSKPSLTSKTSKTPTPSHDN